MTNITIFIDKILKPITFANQLIEFLFDKNNEIKVTILQKPKLEDKKTLKGIYKSSFVENMILKNYSLSLDLNKYRDIRSLLDKYFEKDWGFIVSDMHKGLFSFGMDTFWIDCVDGDD